MFTEYILIAHVRERYSQRETEIGRDSTLIPERERQRDWTLMPDVFMCIYIFVIGEGRKGETEAERGANTQIQRECKNKERHTQKVTNTHARTRHKEKARNMHAHARAQTHTHTHTHSLSLSHTHTRQELAECFPVMRRRHVRYRS